MKINKDLNIFDIKQIYLQFTEEYAFLKEHKDNVARL